MIINKKRTEINGLRGIAVLSVILFHMNFSWFKGGFVGVDIFFVISGYLITRLITNDLDLNKFNYWNFLVRRIRRIFPALFFVVLFSLIMGWFLFLPDDFKSLGRSAFSLAIVASNIYFWLKTGYFSPPAETKPLLHTWTLAVEEQFYLLFPFILFFITRYLTFYRNLIIFFLMITSFIIALYTVKNHQIAAFFLLPMRAWELLIGSLIALVYIKSNGRLKQNFNELMSFFGCLAIGYAIFFYNTNTLVPGWAALVPCLGTVAILAANQNKLTFTGRCLSIRPLVVVGLISYSLYLWHWPLLVFAKYIFDDILNIQQMITLLSICLIISTCSYYLIELPIRQKIIFQNSKYLVAGTVFALVTIAYIGLTIDKKNGIPARLSPKILIVYKEAFYHPQSICKDIIVSKHATVCTNHSLQKPDFLLWGDSHASALLPVIEKLAAQHHLTFWFYSCIPVLNVYQVNENDSLASSNCYISNQEIVKLIAQRQIKNIILASFWSQFTEGREFRMEGAGQRDPFYADQQTKSTSSTQAKKVFKRNFILTLNKLKELGTNVWIVKQVPAHRYWIANQLAKVLKYGGDTKKIGRPLSEYNERLLFINTVFNNLNMNNVHFLDPSAMLCDKHFCYGVNNGHALYSDFNHLSYYGALRLENLFNPLLKANA